LTFKAFQPLAPNRPPIWKDETPALETPGRVVKINAVWRPL
jgi:hypothetical protein